MSGGSTSTIDAEVRRAYLDEAAELLRRIDLAENAMTGGDRDASSEHRHAIARAIHTLKGASSAAGAFDVREDCHAAEDVMSRLDDRPDEAAFGELASVLRRLRGRFVAEALETTPRRTSTSERTETTTPDAELADVLRIRANRVDALHTLARELVSVRLADAAHVQRLVALRVEAEEFLATRSARHRTRPTDRARHGDESAPEVYRAFASLVDGLASVTRGLGSSSVEAANVTSALLDGVSSLRRMPLGSFLEGFVRVARDAAAESGKEVRVTVRAGDVELDRAVLTRLTDPFLHLVRNAIAHGIETPEARASVGKPRAGHLVLEGRSEGARAVLRVVDDGAGIDEQRVRRRATERGLLASTETRALDERELLELITRPGFSTRSDVDTLAGRGIGLDVVRHAVESLSGQIELQTIAGVGTVFAVEVPIATSMSPAIIVRVGATRVAILLANVERVVRFDPRDLAESGFGVTLRVGDSALGVVSLDALFGARAKSSSDATMRSAVVLASGPRRLVLVVDELDSERSLVVRPMPDAFSGCSAFDGAAVEEDGSILPVLRVAHVLDLASNRPHLGRPESSRASDRGHGDATVLVVDDSMTMRTLLGNILRGAGYSVVVAEDGRAGFEEFERLDRCDLVVSDFEMPRMTGAELAQAVRGTRKGRTPFVVVTSVSNSDERSRAMNAGADAYIIKSQFDQDEFVDLVDRLVRGEIAP